MATNLLLQNARFAEVAAISGAEKDVKALSHDILAPSGKQYAKQRDARIERWQQLAALALTQVERLQALATEKVPRKRATKAVPAVMPPPATTAGEAAATA